MPMQNNELTPVPSIKDLVQLMKRAVIDSLNELNSEEISPNHLKGLDNSFKPSIHTTNKGVRHGY